MQAVRRPAPVRSYSAACTSFSSRAASAPRILAMSSWYFSSTPSVSSTAAGVSSRLVQVGQRARPVDRLGDAGQLEQLLPAQPLHEGDHLSGQRPGTSGALAARIARSRAASG